MSTSQAYVSAMTRTPSVRNTVCTIAAAASATGSVPIMPVPRQMVPRASVRAPYRVSAPGSATCVNQQGSIGGVTTKLTISVPDDVAAEAREAVRTGRAASISGYLVAAVQHYRKSMTLSEWLDQADADAGGPPSAAAFAHIDAQTGMSQDPGSTTP